MGFPFNTVYEKMAKSLEGKQLQDPFGPYYMLQTVVDGAVYLEGFSPTDFILNFFLVDGGQEKLYELIRNQLSESDDNHCVVLVHEGLFKMFSNEGRLDHEASLALKEKGLMYDRNSQHAVVIIVFHKSGTRMGFCPINANRTGAYGPMIEDEEPEIHHVIVGADQTCH